MEPMDDGELDELLREWQAPAAPGHLRAPVRTQPWWRWLMTGTIRVPVPVGLAAAVALLVGAWMYSSATRDPGISTQPASTQPAVSLADFQPVAEAELRYVGDLR